MGFVLSRVTRYPVMHRGARGQTTDMILNSPAALVRPARAPWRPGPAVSGRASTMRIDMAVIVLPAPDCR
jgi:hypothetical protein